MALLKIRIYGDPVLRQVAQPVAEVTPELRQLALDMLDTMYDAPGIGLAAPQIGASIRLIVVDLSEKEGERAPFVFFNPEIIPETEPCWAEEGCLSVPNIYAQVHRPEVITVKALGLDGQPFELKGVDGLFARCIQHEIDHLNGVLFVDKLRPADRILYESKLKKMARRQKAG